MTTIPVVWMTLHPGTGPRGYWDQGILEEVFAGRFGGVPSDVEFDHYEPFCDNRDELRTFLDDLGGAIVIVPGRMNVGREDEYADLFETMQWVVLVVTSDEEHLFDPKPVVDRLGYTCHVWWQTPPPGRCGEDWFRVLPLGYRTGTPATASQAASPGFWGDRLYAATFCGQDTHERRHAAVGALNRSQEPDGLFLGATERFGSGLPFDVYMRVLGNARYAPCPSGPVCHETFRMYEALEAGTVPLLDLKVPDGDAADGRAYWTRVLGAGHPLELVDDWDRTIGESGLMFTVTDEQRRHAAAVDAWWQHTKRDLVVRLLDDVQDLAGPFPRSGDPADWITVLMPTSPIPSHPSTVILDQTVASIEERLPGVEVLLMIDGVRPEQADSHGGPYLRYVETVLDWTRRRTNVVPVLFDRHTHQAGMTRTALGSVRTPTVLFVEHDTPLEGDVPWDDIVDEVAWARLDSIRFHHETEIPESHGYLMSAATETDGGLPVVPTVQWSQRPHLARTSWYRELFADHFPDGYVGMIEDRMHGIAQRPDWSGRLAIYNPFGSIKRSGHLDGRGSDPKWPVGDVPE